MPRNSSFMSYLRISKFIGTEIQRLIQSGRSGERNGELLFNERTDYVWDCKRLLDTGAGRGGTVL